jgi:2-oxoglutarate dehydrogenase E2 component (dihydrolipoamide succinyltransferase)
MRIEVLMPKMGESITEGKIIKWHKKPGDKIEKDEILLEISTDKVDTEIPSSASGILADIIVPEQEVAPVGAVIAHIETDFSASIETRKEAPSRVSIDIASSTVGEKATEAAEVKVSARTGGGVRKFFSPLVRAIARSEGISFDELSAIQGTGSGGRVTKQDLLAYIERKSPAKSFVPASKPEPVATPQAYNKSKSTIVPMDNLRQRIMEHMIRSRDTSVHVAAISEADMTGIANYIDRNAVEFQNREGFKLTYMPFIANACVKALKDFPLVNSSIEGTNIIMKNYVNLGIAVAIETTGLIVPVLKGADEKNILGLARGIYDLAMRARTKKLTPDDIVDSTFSITNYGVFGNLMGTPIINQPNIAILGVGVVQKRPVVINDAIAIRQMAYLTLSFDHRLIDGALGGQFLEKVIYYLENFDTTNQLYE